MPCLRSTPKVWMLWWPAMWAVWTNGMSVVCYGHMVNHPSYGEQFRADQCEASLPQDTAATLSYLSSGALPYIGPSTAKKIVAKFGDDTLNIIADQPMRLCELRGIAPEKAEAIAKEFHRMYGVREVVAWAANYGISAQNAVSLYRDFGTNAVAILEDNPYLLTGEPLNLKFSQVDAIAAKLQFEHDGTLRVGAGLIYAMRHNANNRPHLPAEGKTAAKHGAISAGGAGPRFGRAGHAADQR